ncbi:MAG TPA: hypothetical protein VEA44_07325, partial [Caulobacter sp.]|nr:hypothetical protein [Caulobacter sp.]
EADRRQVTLSELLVDAAEMQMYAGSEAWVAAVQEGIDDLDAGRTFSQDEVVQSVEVLLRSKGAPPST